MRLVLFGVIAIVLVVAVIIGLVSYSYTQVNVTFDDATLSSVELIPISFSKLLELGLEALTGNWMGAALGLIESVNLDLTFGLTNGGFLPVYIPDLTYFLEINEIPIGQGSSSVDLTINPGETRQILVLQQLEGQSLEPVAQSLLESEGIMDIKVSGTAYFDLLGMEIPVSFESEQQVSILDELQNRIDEITG